MSDRSRAKQAGKVWANSYVSIHYNLSRFELLAAAGPHIINQPSDKARIGYYDAVWEESLKLPLTSPH